MKLSISPSTPKGQINAIASKSAAHRALICAAFSDRPTKIVCEATNNDIEATAACLSALGARVERRAPYYTVTPVRPENITRGTVLPAGESGSTLRFLLPVAAALGAECTFTMAGRLPLRPLSPLSEELEAHGIKLIKSGNELTLHGKLCGNSFCIDGGVSSQFVSGLLFALALMDNNATLTVSGNIESAPYIKMTEDALASFGVAPDKQNNAYIFKKSSRFISPELLKIEGDWSNAAFPLCMGVLGGDVTLGGLNMAASQGDRAVLEILRRMGADIKEADGNLTAAKSKLCSTEIDASQIPDLVPVLAVVASVAKGKTTIYGASRLRLKESDRLATTAEMLGALGADVTVTDDGLVIVGKERLIGGNVSSHNDHRIAMSAAVASVVCNAPVKLDGAEAVAKSYPAFWQDIEKLGVKIDGNE